MIDIQKWDGDLTEREQSVVTRGFQEHSREQAAPAYDKRKLKWMGTDESGELTAVLTAEVLWDWMYLDELWVSHAIRGKGVGKRLVHLAEENAIADGLHGIWLWTQSWQAAGFYEHLGYQEFSRFPNFPEGHQPNWFQKGTQAERKSAKVH